MKKFCYLNGKILPTDRARITLTNLGLLRGYGVFEYLVTYHGRLFCWSEHFARLTNSAKQLGMKVPLASGMAADIIQKLIAKNKLPEAGIKLVLTGGPSPDGITRRPDSSTFFILAGPRPHYPEKLYTHGARVITAAYQREFPTIKSTNYQMALALQPRQKRARAVEILYTRDGLITECSRSNFFIFKNNTLITPKADILPGITRRIVLQFAKDKFKIEQRPLRLAELKSASEAFLTSTDREVMPVVKVDNLVIDSGRVGSNTRALIIAFRAYTASH